MAIDLRQVGFGWAALLTLHSSDPVIAGNSTNDFKWATISDPGNQPYPGSIENRFKNRGSVDYTYRISKLEVSSGQWLEFMNSAGPLLGDVKSIEPRIFGYFALFPGQYVPITKHASRVPVQGVSWRTAAMYVNWLHNDKAPGLEAISDGVYDISTFGTNPDGSLNDQPAHHPDAKFWIPTLDEWLKAAHYDPNKFGSGQAGWWEYTTTSDTAPVPGPPGVGETSADHFIWESDGAELHSQYVPLGAYPDVTSPWGLLDTSGGASEWLEDSYQGYRLGDGSHAGTPAHMQGDIELIGELNGNPPDVNLLHGLRIASSIPAPMPTAAFGIAFAAMASRRTRRSITPTPSQAAEPSPATKAAPL